VSVPGLRVRWADWRDRQPIQELRQLQPDTVRLDGGLWELLSWPVYHTTIALVNGEPVGFAASNLWPLGVADEVGWVVKLGWRDQGIGWLLRGAQWRDLMLLGWRQWYTAIPREAEVGRAATAKVCGGPQQEVMVAGLPPHELYGGDLASLLVRYRQSYPEPYALTTGQEGRLRSKGVQAVAWLTRQLSVHAFHARKALLIHQLAERRGGVHA